MANLDRTDASKAKVEKACNNENQKTKARSGKTQRFKKQEQPQCCTQCRDDAGTDHAAKTFKADWGDAPTCLLCI